MFSKYKELTSHINLDLIKELDIESDHYKNLIEELKIKVDEILYSLNQTEEIP